MSVTTVSNPTFQSPLDLQEPFKAEDIAKTLEQKGPNHIWIPILVGIAVGTAVAAVAIAVLLVSSAIIATIPPAAVVLTGLQLTAVIVCCTTPALGIFGSIFAGFGAGFATHFVMDYTHYSVIDNLKDSNVAQDQQKIMEQVARIKSNETLAQLAERMNFRQLTVLKAGIGSKRFGNVINLTQNKTRALKAWKQIHALETERTAEDSLKIIGDMSHQKLFLSKDFKESVEAICPNIDIKITVDLSKKMATPEDKPRSTLYSFEGQFIDVPTSGSAFGNVCRSFSGILQNRFSAGKPVELVSQEDFDDMELLFSYAARDLESVTLCEFKHLYHVAEKWQQEKILNEIKPLMEEYQFLMECVA